MAAGGMAYAAACEDSSDCAKGYVCKHDECLEVPAICQTFCEEMQPCFPTETVECTGSCSIEYGDGDVLTEGECEEECHREPITKDLMDDCLGDCSGALLEEEAAVWMNALMICLEEADYDCDAKDGCMEEVAGSGCGGEEDGGGCYGDVFPSDRDVVTLSGWDGGDDGGEQGTAKGTSDLSTDATGGGSGKGCSATGMPVPEGKCLLVFFLAVAALLALRSVARPRDH